MGYIYIFTSILPVSLKFCYAGQEATVRTGHETMDWFKIVKGIRQGFRIVNEAEVDVFLEFPCFFSELATRPGADCVSDHELLIAKFRLKLKKVEKTTRPFRYDLNQIPLWFCSGGEEYSQGIRSSRQSA